MNNKDIIFLAGKDALGLVCQFGFCDAELEEEVELDGDVVGIIADVESDDLALGGGTVDGLGLDEGEDEAVGLFTGKGLDAFLAHVVEYLFLHAATIHHGIGEALTGSKQGGVEGSGVDEQRYHVVDGTGVGVVALTNTSVGINLDLLGAMFAVIGA